VFPAKEIQLLQPKICLCPAHDSAASELPALAKKLQACLAIWQRVLQIEVIWQRVQPYS
jgi:hypothetical protein